MPKPEKDWYTFQCWRLTIDANTYYDYPADEIIKIVSGKSESGKKISYGSHTLTAVYDPNICTVKISINNGAWGKVDGKVDDFELPNVFYEAGEPTKENPQAKFKVLENNLIVEKTITAQPNDSTDSTTYEFINWTWSDKTTENGKLVWNITANFKENQKPKFTLKFNEFDFKVDNKDNDRQYVKVQLYVNNTTKNEWSWTLDKNSGTPDDKEIYVNNGDTVSVQIEVYNSSGAWRLTCEWKSDYSLTTAPDLKEDDKTIKSASTGANEGYITLRKPSSGERRQTFTLKGTINQNCTLNLVAYSGLWDKSTDGNH